MVRFVVFAVIVALLASQQHNVDAFGVSKHPAVFRNSFSSTQLNAASSVWVQLYYERQDEPNGNSVEIEPVPKNIGALAREVKKELELDARLNLISVYPPDTTPSFLQDKAKGNQNRYKPGKPLEEVIDELKNTTPPTSDDHPLIVVAPAPQQQPEYGPSVKRQRELQKWSELQNSVKSPAEVPLPVLMEEDPPPFVAPKGWLDDLCEEVRVQFNHQDSEKNRVSPVAVVRCSRGGKTRALHELAWALPKTLKKNNETGTAIIYVSFNGHTSVLPWEESRPLEALCRRIIYTALGGKPDRRAFDSFATSTVIEKEDVTSWLGDASCVLLIDELNLLESTMNKDFATFLKDKFLFESGRALVFSSHVVSVNDKLLDYMLSPSERGVKIKKLPLAQNLSQARELLDYAALSPHLALYLGLIPALYYVSKENNLPHERRQRAIQKYLAAGVSTEKVEELLTTMLTGEYTVVPEVFRELMDIDVIENNPAALWIPHHMAEVLQTLSRQSVLPRALRGCLSAISEQFHSFKTHKIQSGDGWEALFIVTLLTRCLTKSFCELIPPLRGFDGEVSWNEPFDTKVNFRCESVEEFVTGIPLRRSTKSISIYFPTHAKFQVYDVILAYWGDDLERQLYGYQLKEGSTPPKGNATEDFFRSYHIRGNATTKDSIIRQWVCPSDDALDDFFGVSAKNWSPKCWAELQNSSSSPVPLGNGKST